MDISKISVNINDEMMPIANQNVRLASIISIICVILGIISIILIIVARNKNKEKEVLRKWLVMCGVSFIIFICAEKLKFSGIGFEHTPFSFGLVLLLYFITFIFNVAMIIYPIYIIRKNKTNKS